MSVFRKYLRKEVEKSADLQIALERLLKIADSFVFKKTVFPFAKLIKDTSEDLAYLANGSAGVLSDALEESGRAAFTRANDLLRLPFSAAGAALHAGILKLGRKITPGKEYEPGIKVHPWAEGPEDARIPPSARLQRAKCTKSEMQKYVPSVISGSKYQELAQRYSPHSWQDLQAAYSKGELLGVNSVQIKGRERPRVSFQTDMYRENEDRVFKMANTWTLSPETGTAGYKIHKIESAEIL